MARETPIAVETLSAGPDAGAGRDDTVLVSLVSLGCPKNLIDSERILGRIADDDLFALCPDPEAADVIIVNTCSFIESAKQESIDTLLEMARLKKEGPCRAVIVAGCMVERYVEDLRREMPELDGFIGIRHYDQFPATIRSILGKTAPPPREAPARAAIDPRMEDRNRVLLTPAHSAYLRISEGCDNPCTFCAIPTIRGRFRSKPLEEIVFEATQLVRGGAKELNVIGQDTTSYGRDLGPGYGIHDLLQALGDVPDVRWVRLLYAYPTYLTAALADTIAGHPRIVKYLDMPLQHGSLAVLRRMGRGRRADEIRDDLRMLRRRIPELFLRTTVIVGFPGETETEFEELLGFIEEARFDRLGAFTYSPEEGTPSFRLKDSVPADVKARRYRRVMEVQQAIAFERNRSLVGTEIECLIDGPDPKVAERHVGRTYGDAPDIDGRVFVRGATAPGEILNVRITGHRGYDLLGEVGRAPFPEPLAEGRA